MTPINPISNPFSGVPGAAPVGPAGAGGKTGGVTSSGFADMLSQRITEVARMQEEASKAVEKAVTGGSDDMSGVMTAVEKSDLAFKTLLAIRTKLLEAYDEIKNMQV